MVHIKVHKKLIEVFDSSFYKPLHFTTAKMVFCSGLLYVRKNCSNDREIFLTFEAEDPEFAKCLRSLEQFIQSVKCQNNF